MGRTKGSKNKPKAVDTPAPKKRKAPEKVPSIVSTPKAAISVKEEPKHIFFEFLDYVMERMDGLEMGYYQREARRKGMETRVYVAKSLLAFFRLHDSTVTNTLEKL